MSLLSRRQAVAAVGALMGYLHGKSVQSEQVARAQQPSRGLSFILDGIDGIIVQYDGEKVVVTPSEIMSALRPERPSMLMRKY